MIPENLGAEKIHGISVADPGFSPGGGAPTPKSAIIFQFFAENCMKMKEFGPPGGARVPGAPPLDPPMHLYTCVFHKLSAIQEIKCVNFVLVV